jgi:hypothetical protein
LDTALLRLEVAPQRIAGEYRAICDGSRVLAFRLSSAPTTLSVRIDGVEQPLDRRMDNEIRVTIGFQTGQNVRFELNWG